MGNNFGTDLGVGLGLASALPDKCPKSIGRVKLLHPKKTVLRLKPIRWVEASNFNPGPFDDCNGKKNQLYLGDWYIKCGGIMVSFGKRCSDYVHKYYLYIYILYIYIIPIFCRLPLEITFWDVLATSRFVDGQKTDFHENVGFIQRNSANGQNNGLLLVFHAVMIGLKSSTTPWRNFTGSYSFTFNYLYCLFESALFARIMTPFHVPKK